MPMHALSYVPTRYISKVLRIFSNRRTFITVDSPVMVSPHVAFASSIAPVTKRCHSPLLCTRPNSFVSAPIRLVQPHRSYQNLLRIQPCASVQQQTLWNPVTIVENTETCEDHHYVVVNVGTTDQKGSLCDSYRIPGQYVQIRSSATTKPAFLAISSGPTIYGYFEFLIKTAEAVEWLCASQKGDIVEMSPIMGKGFPMSKLDQLTYPETPEHKKVKDILLFATGSGIAPIRASIEAVLNGINIPTRRSVKLFYGARYPARMPYMDRFHMWEKDGVDIIPVMSRPDEASPSWHGRTGYIQDALRDIGIHEPEQTGAILCGIKEMTEDVTSILTDAGVPSDRILLNF